MAIVYFNGARLAIFENSGHAVFMEERVRFNQELKKFLNE